MRISDWSSDVCSSDLRLALEGIAKTTAGGCGQPHDITPLEREHRDLGDALLTGHAWIQNCAPKVTGMAPCHAPGAEPCAVHAAYRHDGFQSEVPAVHDNRRTPTPPAGRETVKSEERR